MDKLPPEILHEIFIQLGLHQRCICWSVCRSWRRLLDTHSLYYNVYFNEKYINSCHEFIDYFTNNPIHANHVNKLEAVFNADSLFNKRHLFTMLPSVCHLSVSQGSSPTPTLATQDIDLMYPGPRLVSLIDDCHCELVSQMLYSNLGGRLKVLDLYFGSIPRASCILSRLRDLPVLKILKLTCLEISIDNLEAIHENVPSIQEFSLSNVQLRAASIPSNIVPASFITKFLLFAPDPDSVATHGQFYRYMAQKYTSLNDVYCCDLFLNGYNSNDRGQVYLNGALDFWRLIGPTRKELVVYALPDHVDLFAVFDSGNAQIKKVVFHPGHNQVALRQLCSSNQANHVKQLFISNTRITLIHFIQNMTALTVLKIKVDQILGEPFHAQLNSVKVLCIISRQTTPYLGNMISICFPNLVRFALQCAVTENMEITLRSPRLSKAVFIPYNRNVISGFRFKTPNDLDTLYLTTTRPHFRRIKKTYQHDDRLMNAPILTVKSLKDARIQTNGGMNKLYIVPVIHRVK